MSTQSQPLLLSLESKAHSGPLSSSSSSSSFTGNATTRNMRSATVSSAPSGYQVSDTFRSRHFSPYPSTHPSRRCTISGISDPRQHTLGHSPQTSSLLLDEMSSSHHQNMMYHPPNPPPSDSPSPGIAPSVMLPDCSISMTTPNYGYVSSPAMDSEDPVSMYPAPSHVPRDLYFPTSPYIPSIHAREKELEDEIKVLQGRIRSLELMLPSTQTTGSSTGLTSGSRYGGAGQSTDIPQFSFNLALGRPPSDWEARTRTRERIFCSLNRAGNALCAWHDPRRERRKYAPRMAPPRTLNCGCTYEQALFEESLARNGVGNYWPGGELVRMDPILRNALLSLLEEKFNYRDGDFERNLDGTWKNGQDAAAWEEKSLRPLRRPQ